MQASGMTPEKVAAVTVTAMLQRKLTVLPADMAPLVEQRAARLARSDAALLGGGSG